MSVVWILVSDAAKARLFASSEEGNTIVELETFINPDARTPGRELSRGPLPVSHDRMGSHRHTIEPHTTLRAKSAMSFAQELGEMLKRGLDEKRFDQLLIAAPARFMGSLNKSLDKQVRSRLLGEISKNYTSADLQVIRSLLPLKPSIKTSKHVRIGSRSKHAVAGAGSVQS